jgi:predicted ABC-type transport system involved in lysophospholipase L1 biosynthesis ATPase subunit
MPDDSRARALNYLLAVALVTHGDEDASRLLRGAQGEAVFAAGDLVKAMTACEVGDLPVMVDHLVKAREELKAALVMLRGLVGDE